MMQCVCVCVAHVCVCSVVCVMCICVSGAVCKCVCDTSICVCGWCGCVYVSPHRHAAGAFISSLVVYTRVPSVLFSVCCFGLNQRSPIFFTPPTSFM